jgi:hypothetical protein
LPLENAITTAAILNRSELEKVFAQLADALQQLVKNSGLDRRSQEDFLKNLASWPIILREVAAAQSRLPNGKDSQPDI